MTQAIRPEDHAEWLLHPVTRAMREQMKVSRENLKEEWACGRYAKDPLVDAYVRGQCVILQQFIDLDHSDLEGS